MNLIENAKSILLSSMAAKPGENVLVVTDDSKLEIGNAIYLAAKELGCEAMLMVMGERSVSGEEPRGGHRPLSHRQIPDPHQRPHQCGETGRPHRHHAKHHQGDV